MGDIDISREAVSKEIAALQKCEADPRCYYQFEETRALLGTLRAALDAAESRAVRPDIPLGAVVMREKAAEIAERYRDMCGECNWPEEAVIVGGNVANDITQSIRALPLPTGDELFAAAAERPEVRALVEAAASFMATGKYWEVGNLEAALAPFTRKGE